MNTDIGCAIANVLYLLFAIILFITGYLAARKEEWDYMTPRILSAIISYLAGIGLFITFMVNLCDTVNAFISYK